MLLKGLALSSPSTSSSSKAGWCVLTQGSPAVIVPTHQGYKLLRQIQLEDTPQTDSTQTGHPPCRQFNPSSGNLGQLSLYLCKTRLVVSITKSRGQLAFCFLSQNSPRHSDPTPPKLGGLE